jgi:hypothetical protein
VVLIGIPIGPVIIMEDIILTIIGMDTIHQVLASPHPVTKTMVVRV